MTRIVSIEIAGLTDLNALLTDLDDQLDIERVLDRVAGALLSRTRVRFLQQVDPDGNPWQESQAAKIRKATGRDGGTLFDTGTLFNSIQVFTDAPGVRGIGTDVPYAPDHQFGLEGNPVRQFLGFSEEDVDVAEAIVIDSVDRALKQRRRGR